MSTEHLIKVKSAIIWKPDWLMENLISNENQDILFDPKSNTIYRNAYFEDRQHIYYGSVFRLEVEEKLTRDPRGIPASIEVEKEDKKEFQMRAWKYLTMRLGPLKDDNKTARNIFNYFIPSKECQIEWELAKSLSNTIKKTEEEIIDVPSTTIKVW